MQLHTLFGILFLATGGIADPQFLYDNMIDDVERNNKQKSFRPQWSDLDTRELPEWYDKAKIGIFVHWGVYSVPSFESEWFWKYWQGNALINVGPTPEGTIPNIFMERLLILGTWLLINGDAIYGTSPWLSQKDTLNEDVWYTCVKERYNSVQPTAPPSKTDIVNAIYAIILRWPPTSMLKVKDITNLFHSANYKVEMVGNEGTYLDWKISNGDTDITLPDKATVVSDHAWTLKFTLK